jgi:hypothetical protein
VNAYQGPPMTLGNAAAAQVRLIVWCLATRRQVEPDPAALAERYGAPRHASLTGVSGSSVPGAAAATSTWW